MGGVRTFVLMGDGEIQEGQVWEAALYAGAHKVRGLVGIIDMNGVQLHLDNRRRGPTRADRR